MKSRRFLVVDVGNSSTDLGVYTGKAVRSPDRIETHRVTQRRIRAAIRRTLGEQTVTRAVLASVVPEACEAWEHAVRATCGCACLRVDHRVDIGVPVTYPKPETLGADRLANACGAVARFGTPVIAADFGTALTFDVITPGQGLIGGVIAPGLPMMLEYLADRTCKLPRISTGPVRRAIGRSTEEAMRVGAHHGYLGLVREILQQLIDEVGADGLTVCATGGFAGEIARRLNREIRRVPHLTLLGLGRIGELNE